MTKSWDKHLRIRMIQWGLNTMINDSTKVSPHTLLFNYNPRDIMQNQLLMMFAAEVIGRIEKEQRKQKHYFDKSRRPARQYLEGELILVEKDPQATGLSKKLEPKYKGAYLVERALDNDRYLIVDVPGVQLKQKKTSTIFAADRMKPWSVNASLEDSDYDNMSSEDSDETM